MNQIPYIDIHTHSFRNEKDTIIVQNIFPGEGFGVFAGRNFYSVGLHPWHIKSEEENNEALDSVIEALEFDHVIFVGECGLDKLANTNFEEQIRVFEAHAVMAEEFRKPLLIHCVKAYNEVLELRKKMQPIVPWILHAYNGSREMTEQLEANGIMFSFGLNLFREGTKAHSSFLSLPLDKIFFETDEYQGEVEEIYRKGAGLKKIEEKELVEACWANFNRMERISTNLF